MMEPSIGKKTVTLATLATAVLLCGAAGAAVGATEGLIRPRPAPFETVQKRLLKAKRAVVSPACGSAISPWAYRGRRGQRQMLQAYARAEQSQEWSREFAEALLHRADWDSVHKFRGIGKPCEETHQVPLFTVTWRGGGAETYALLSFETRCAALFEAEQPLGMVDFGDRADTLFALIRAALAGDSLVRAMSTPPEAKMRLDASTHLPTPVMVDKFPEVVERVAPHYPKKALEAEIEGKVYVVALVDTSGTVKDAYIGETSQKLPLLDDAALEAVWQWKFSPGAFEGTPVALWVAVPVRFSIR